MQGTWSGKPETLIGILQRSAAADPARVAFTFFADGEDAGDRNAFITFGQLHDAAQRIAGQLRRQVTPGTRACLFYPAGLDYISALFGCFYAGLIAVPAYPPRSPRRLQRLETLIEDPSGVMALTNSATFALLQPSLEDAAGAFRELRWFLTDSLPDFTEEPVSYHEADPDSAAIIQYTSGSTSTARGVVLSHRNLLHNLGQIRQQFGVGPETRSLTWLPPYHDMGLIGQILEPVYAGAWCGIMSPSSFMQRPLRWLELISRYRVTVSGGPNFAYDLCARKIPAEARAKLDLSSWQVAFNGAEAVRAETMGRFSKLFASCGFQESAFFPCYGLAEATLVVTAHQRSRPIAVHQAQAAALSRNMVISDSTDTSIGLAGSGQSIPDTTIRIVDPESRALCRPEEVGEIWISNPSVARGYWNRPEQTAATFGATLQNDPEGTRFLRTGDLGFLLGGELYVTGRIKDLIVIRGANHYAQAIEASAEAGEPVIRPGSCAAFGIDDGQSEGLVVVVEASPGAKSEPDRIFRAVRKSIAEVHGLEISGLALVKPGAIPRTSSGKIRHAACKAAYLDGSLKRLAEWSAESREDTAPGRLTKRNPRSATGSPDGWHKGRPGKAVRPVSVLPGTLWIPAMP